MDNQSCLNIFSKYYVSAPQTGCHAEEKKYISKSDFIQKIPQNENKIITGHSKGPTGRKINTYPEVYRWKHKIDKTNL